MGERLTRREARLIARRKLEELRESSAEDVVARFSPHRRGPEITFDETDPLSGKPYMCTVVAAEAQRSGEVLLTVQVQPPFPDPPRRPRFLRLQVLGGLGGRWVLPVQRSLRVPSRRV